MAIEIRPLVGMRRAREVDTGLDQIYVVDALCPQGKRIGFAHRTPGAPLQLTDSVAESIIVAARRALAERDGIEALAPYVDAPDEVSDSAV